MTDPVVARLASRLYADVGAFFCNTLRHDQRVCVVCTGPAKTQADPPLCAQCRSGQETYGTTLADLVVPLAYAKGRMPSIHQSAHHVRAYKALTPAPECAQDLQLMMGAATYLHGRCITATVGWWQVVTFVPSAGHSGGEHPVAALARTVHGVYPAASKIALATGPGFDLPPTRTPRPDRFVVPEEYRPAIVGQHVLVVDDTWVSGNKAQSAALALKAAGATCVTVLCATRWLRYDWTDHRDLIESLVEPYDAMRCPVSGGRCP
jgi:hypothetical protein